MQDDLIASWESISGKHWVSLYQCKSKQAFGVVGTSYRYVSNGGAGGYLGVLSSPDVAIATMEQKVASGYFLPDSAKTPMKRVV